MSSMYTYTRKSYRTFMKGLGRLWNDAQPQLGVKVVVTETHDESGNTTYTVESDGKEHGVCGQLLGYQAKNWVMRDVLAISDYQDYQEICAPTPTWRTIARIATARGCDVTIADGRMVFIG